MADPFPRNPFKPGFGRPPSHMGHRPEIERPLLDVLASLRDGEADNHLACLYGPRGNGKTVLLRWLREKARTEGGGLPVARVALIPEHLESSERLCRRVVGALKGTPGIMDHVSVDLETGIPGLFKLRVGKPVTRTRFSGCRTGWSGTAIRSCSPRTRRMRRMRGCSAGF